LYDLFWLFDESCCIYIKFKNYYNFEWEKRQGLNGRKKKKEVSI
jgi:hypothetical protein